jgi:hypothetical protein
MAKKQAKSPTVMGIGSRSYVCPSFWGLSGKPWSRVEAVSEEASQMMERYNRLGAERQQLMEELDYQHRQHRESEIEAARRDEDLPEPKYIAATKKAIERIDKKLAALKAAADRVDNEYQAALSDLRVDSDELVADLIARGRQHHQEYLRLVAQAERERDMMGVFLGVSRFLSYQQDALGPPANDGVGNPWWRQNIRWPDEPAPDPTISTQSAGSLL